MKKLEKIILIIALILCFSIFIFPNMVGSADQNMLSVFEPDEFAQYPHVIRMITPSGGVANSIRKFFAYQHYYYGFPFYFFSAITILPIKLLSGGLQSNTPIVMLTLRQMISVLPMISVVLLFIYIQKKLSRRFESILLGLLLFSIPAVFENNFWWHPESLVLLFITLVFFFLQKDALEFGKNFWYAAIATGLATGTKLLGLYFFLTIPTYILYGLVTKRIKLKRAVMSAGGFVLLMFVTFLVSNPLLVTNSGRAAYLNIQTKQMEAMAFGWQVAYGKGPAFWLDIIREKYGSLLFVGFAFLGLFWGIKNKETRLQNLLYLTWIVPYSVYILFFIAIKPTHFFLPVILPLYASLSNIIDTRSLMQKKLNWRFVGSGMVILLIAFQIVTFTQYNVDEYRKKLSREKNNPSISFYQEVKEKYLDQIADQSGLTAYRDVRLYVPNSTAYEVEIKWGTIDYSHIQQNNYDMLFIWKQRALDYTQEDNVETAADPEMMQGVYDFYWDVRNASVEGYILLHETQAGYYFVNEDLFANYFSE